MSTHEILRRIAGNTAWLMFDRVIRMLVGVIIGTWVARHLGPLQFGELAYALAFIAIFQTATSLGLDLMVARELPKNPTQAHMVLGTVLRLRLCAGVVGIFVACFGMILLRPGDTQALVMTAVLAFGLLLQPADLVDLWFQSQTQSRRAVLPRLLAYAIASLARITMILNDAPLWAFAAAYLVESFLTVVLLNFSYRASPVKEKWSWNPQMAGDLLQHSWPLLVSGLSIIFYMRMDQLFLRNMVGAQELGIYSAILPFSQAWHFIPTTLCATATPFLVQLYSKDRGEFMRRFQQLFTIVVWLSIVICVLVALLSGLLVELFLGHTYIGADRVLSVHVFSNIPVFLGVAQTLLLTITNRTGVILAQTFIGLCASLVLNLLLIPYYGALGSAFAAVFALSISSIFCNAVLARDVFRMQLLSMVKINVKKN